MHQWMHLGTASCDFGGRSAGEAADATCTAPSPTTAGTEGEGLLLNFEEVRAVLRVSKNTLSRLATSGQIPGARKIGRAWRFRRDLLAEWLAGGATRARARRPGR